MAHWAPQEAARGPIVKCLLGERGNSPHACCWNTGDTPRELSYGERSRRGDSVLAERFVSFVMNYFRAVCLTAAPAALLLACGSNGGTGSTSSTSTGNGGTTSSGAT